MFISMSMHQKDNNETVKSNFVISCLTFRGLNPNKKFPVGLEVIPLIV